MFILFTNELEVHTVSAERVFFIPGFMAQERYTWIRKPMGKTSKFGILNLTSVVLIWYIHAMLNVYLDERYCPCLFIFPFQFTNCGLRRSFMSWTLSWKSLRHWLVDNKKSQSFEQVVTREKWLKVKNMEKLFLNLVVHHQLKTRQFTFSTFLL